MDYLKTCSTFRSGACMSWLHLNTTLKFVSYGGRVQKLIQNHFKKVKRIGMACMFLDDRNADNNFLKFH